MFNYNLFFNIKEQRDPSFSSYIHTWQAAVDPDNRGGGSASPQSPSTPPSRSCPSSPYDTTSAATPGRWQCLPLRQLWCLRGVLSCKRRPLHLQSCSRCHLHLSLHLLPGIKIKRLPRLLTTTRRSQLRGISNLRSTVHCCLHLLPCRSRKRPLLQGVSHPGR